MLVLYASVNPIQDPIASLSNSHPQTRLSMAITDSKGQLPPGMLDAHNRTITNPSIKDQVIFEKYSAETGGEYTKLNIKVSPGGGTAIHYHNSYDETFHAITGDLGVVVGEDTFQLRPGETKTVPVGTKHRFFNPYSDRDVTFTTEVRPAHEGFERSLYILYGLARDGYCGEKGLPNSMMHLCLVADMGDMSAPGAIGKIIVKAFAAYARWTGEEERLLQRYWFMS